MGYFLIVVAYLLGSIPFGLVFGKCIGIDVRDSGSGNIGATNVNRLLGKKMGLLTLLADSCKAVVPMLIASVVLAGEPDQDFWVVMSGGAAFLGHLYPVYLKFVGGKGVATALGVFLFLEPLALVLVVAAFVFFVGVWGYVSLGSIMAAALMPLSLWMLGAPLAYFWLSVFVAVLVWVKHKDNIVRLIRHEENSIKKKTKDNTA